VLLNEAVVKLTSVSFIDQIAVPVVKNDTEAVSCSWIVESILLVGAVSICTMGGPRACTATITEFVEDLVLSKTVT
jgi:hypothetical protein